MCNWKPTALLDPQNFSFLSVAKENQNQAASAPEQPAIGGAGDNRQPVYAHCLDFTEGEQDYFYVGSEDFKIYQCQKQDGSVQGIFQDHHAPLTAVQVHPGQSQSDKHSEMADLLISSSMDWTVKLWQPRTRAKPLMTFESGQEYVYDVQWSPVHPSVFASCDADGFVDVWNINGNVEVPVVRK